MGVAVAVGVAAAVDDHRVVQQRLAVDVLDGVQLLQEPGELLHVPQVDLGDLLQDLFLVVVVRQVVMALGDPDVGERPVAPLVGQQEGGDPGRVGLERQDHHVEHELDVLAEGARDAGRRFRRSGLAKSLNRSACSSRRSISRTLVRYSSSFF